MIQCIDCEFGKQTPDGTIRLTCDPTRNVKEEACLTKWMLVSLWNIEKMQAQAMSISNDMMPMHAKLLQHNLARVAEEQKSDIWKQGGTGEGEPTD